VFCFLADRLAFEAGRDKNGSMRVGVLYAALISLEVRSGVIAVVLNDGGRRAGPWWIRDGDAHYGSC
jgi:hypothetical protein